MVRPRVLETDSGITGAFDTQLYDRMMRRLRDKGWLETKLILREGITYGDVLEIGPGPGYLGLEWLKSTENTTLKGLDISEDMVRLAEKNAGQYKLEARATYYAGDSRSMPFEDGSFDAVFSNGSLHEWSAPEAVMNEAARVLKPEGLYCISDLRRDMNPVIRWFMWYTVRPRKIRPGLISSINAAYTKEELEELLPRTNLLNWKVKKNPFGLLISGSM